MICGISLPLLRRLFASEHAYNTQSVLFTRVEVASRSDDGEVAIRILRNHLSVAFGDSSPQGEPFVGDGAPTSRIIHKKISPKNQKIPEMVLTDAGICDNIINCTLGLKLGYYPINFILSLYAVYHTSIQNATPNFGEMKIWNGKQKSTTYL